MSPQSQIDQIEALLAVGQTERALETASRALAADPEDLALNILVGHCFLQLGRRDDAGTAWRTSAALSPNDPEVAILGLRLALTGANRLTMTQRLDQLRSVGGDDLRTRYWIAVGAAAAALDGLARDTVEALNRSAPLEPAARYATAEVDLIISAREGRPATRAEEVATDLLAEDPLDPVAHRIRLRAVALRGRQASRSQELAELELTYLSQAAAVGHLPAGGQLNQVATRAIGSIALGMTWLMMLGVLLAASMAVPAPWPALVALTAWAAALVATVGRITRVARSLPILGRKRLLGPVTRLLTAWSVGYALASVAALAALRPFDQERAIELRLGETRATTRQTIEYQEIAPIPSLPPASIRRPGSTTSLGSRPGGSVAPGPVSPPITAATLPSLPPPTAQGPTRVPIVRTVVVPSSIDPERARAEMRSLTSIAVATGFVAAGLSGAVRRIRRA